MMGDGRLLAGVCGSYCGICEQFTSNVCRGCAYQLGLTNKGECCVFQCCVVDRGLEHCGLCEDFPCSSLCSQGSVDDVRMRLAALTGRNKFGTKRWLDAQKSGKRYSL